MTSTRISDKSKHLGKKNGKERDRKGEKIEEPRRSENDWMSSDSDSETETKKMKGQVNVIDRRESKLDSSDKSSSSESGSDSERELHRKRSKLKVNPQDYQTSRKDRGRKDTNLGKEEKQRLENSQEEYKDSHYSRRQRHENSSGRSDNSRRDHESGDRHHRKGDHLHYKQSYSDQEEDGSRRRHEGRRRDVGLKSEEEDDRDPSSRRRRSRSREREDGLHGNRHGHWRGRDRGDKRNDRHEEGKRNGFDSHRRKGRDFEKPRRRRSNEREGDVERDSENWAATETTKKEEPNFGLSGKLTEFTNTYKGVVIKYNEPPEARKPRTRWRLYPFKGDESLAMLHIHRQSAYLLGRDRKIADIPVDHPSCSKQHSVLQFRLVDYQRPDGIMGKRVKPYIIDLESTNGTYVNNKRIEPRRYVELMEKDVLKFGFSSREYVILHEKSKDDESDDEEVAVENPGKDS